MTETRARESFRFRAGCCEAMAVPVTARLSLALAEALGRDTLTGARALGSRNTHVDARSGIGQ